MDGEMIIKRCYNHTLLYAVAYVMFTLVYENRISSAVENSESHFIDFVHRRKACKSSGSVYRSFASRSSQDDLHRKLFSSESDSFDHRRPMALSAIESRSTSAGAAFWYSHEFHRVPGTSIFPHIDLL